MLSEGEENPLSRVMRSVVAAGLFCVALGPYATGQALPYQNPALTPEERAKDLVSRMTLEEKAEQSINTAPGIPRQIGRAHV